MAEFVTAVLLCLCSGHSGRNVHFVPAEGSGRRSRTRGVAMASSTPPTQPSPAEIHGSWWIRHRDAVLYPAVLLCIAVTGIFWTGALSMVLVPLWMLLGTWLVPSTIARVARR